MGNGLIQDRMEGIVGAGNLLACIVEWGGSNVGPGRLVRDSLGGYMVGELDGDDSERARVLARALEPVGPVRVTDNVRGMIWSKLLINSTFTGLSAVSGLRYGGVAEQGRDAVFALWAEGVAVGDAQGLTLEAIHGSTRTLRRRRARANTWTRLGATSGRRCCRTSTRAATTEVDVVNGGVAARGRELGIRRRATTRVVELVHSMERGERSPSRAGWPTSATRRRRARPTAESPRSPTRRGAASARSSGCRACPGSAGRG